MTECFAEFDHNRDSGIDTDDRATFPKLGKKFELKMAWMVLILCEEHKNSVQKASLNKEPYFVKLHRYSEIVYCENNVQDLRFP